MVPITSLLFPAAFLVALLLPECEVWVLDGYEFAPREALVDFAICNATDRGITADTCAFLRSSARDDDDFDDD